MQSETSLKLRGRVFVGAMVHDVFDALAVELIAVATRSVVDRGAFHLALSGGGTPGPFYQSLVIDPRYRVLPWERIHVWIVDERWVPEDDDRYNFKMIRQTLVDHVPIPAGQVHEVDTTLADPGADYEAQLRGVFGESVSAQAPPRLDYILLGMGDDGHTASLFPGSEAIGVEDRLYVNNVGQKVTPPPRVTMTYPLINAARHVGVLAIGAKKLGMLERVDQQLRVGTDKDVLPITGVDPATHGGGDLTWWLDAGAAGVEG